MHFVLIVVGQASNIPVKCSGLIPADLSIGRHFIYVNDSQSEFY